MKKRITLPTLVILVFTIVTTLAKAEFRISSSGHDASVDGNIIVFEKSRDIYGYNLSTSTEFPICTNPATQTSPTISGNIVVWLDYRNDEYEEYPNIYGYDLNTATEFPIWTNPIYGYYKIEIALSGNIVVWSDDYDIYGYDINTSTEFPICTDINEQYNPAISGNIVVWEDYRNGGWENSDIYGYNLNTSTEFPICVDTNGQYSPAISGNIVVWEDRRSGDDVYGYNLDTSTEFPIYTEPGYKEEITISGNTVVWFDEDDDSLHFYNLKNTTELQFPLAESWISTLSTHGNYVVWSRDEEAYLEYRGVWVLQLDSPDEYLWPIEVNKSVPYYGSTTSMTGMAITSCGYNDTKDIWHSFTPTLSGDYTVSTCGSSFDTTLAIFDANKEGEITCNDDSCGYQSQLTFKAKAGKKYLIRVAGYDGDAGNYVLTISGGDAECVNRPSADLNGDCKVDLQDIAVVCSQWLDCGLDDPDACFP